MQFVKYEATGNDFILVQAAEDARNWPPLARALCHRHFGVGADGLLVLTSTAPPFKLLMFNPDGSLAEVCGNGLRCFAKHVVEAGMAPSGEIVVETGAGPRHVLPYPQGNSVRQVRVNMAQPLFRAEQIPIAEQIDIIPILDYPLTVGRRRLLLGLVSMGNPHAVAFIQSPLARFPLGQIGHRVEHHSLFPQRVNFEIARVLDRQHIEARVWERGAGETLACGSGACAIAVVAHLKGYVDDQVKVNLPGGSLTIDWPGKGDVHLSGEVRRVFNGDWEE